MEANRKNLEWQDRIKHEDLQYKEKTENRVR